MPPFTQQQLVFIQQAADAFVARLRWAWEAAGRPEAMATSYWRSPQENLAARGHPESQHLIGTAMDIVAPQPTAAYIEIQVQARNAGLVALDRGSHIHFQLWPHHLQAVRTVAPQLIL